MQKIKSFNWIKNDRVNRVSDSVFSSNDNQTAFIEVVTDEKYNSLDSVLLVQSEKHGYTKLYTSKIEGNKSLFMLDTTDLIKSKYKLYFRIVDGEKIIESPQFCYEVSEGAELDQLEIPDSEIQAIDDRITILLAKLDIAEKAVVKVQADIKAIENNIVEVADAKIVEIKNTEGMRGPQGIAGEKGEKGDPGVQGVPGEKGADGIVRNLNDGSEFLLWKGTQAEYDAIEEKDDSVYYIVIG